MPAATCGTSERPAVDPRQVRSVGIPDLLIAATAELNDAILLHDDHDFDVIADVAGQRAAWVVSRGTVP